MSEIAVTVYPTRLKLDGSLDLICLNCMATISSAKAEDPEYKPVHVCHPSFSIKRGTAGPEYANLHIAR